MIPGIYSTQDTFTNTNGTTLASHNSEINFSGSPWRRQFAGGTLEIQSNAVKLPADVFGAPFTMYSRDAGSENFIVRLRMAAKRLEVGYFWFRVAADNTAYGFTVNQDTTASALNLVYFNGSTITTLLTVIPGSLVSEQLYWYQVHVVGSSVRIFVEGFSTQLRGEMDNNLTEPFIALGAQRASQIVDAIEVIPLPPGAAGFDISTRLTLLERACDIIATVPPSALADMREFLVDGIALEATIEALGIGAGIGTFEVPFTIRASGGQVVPECDVIVTSTSGSPSANIAASQRTNPNGIVTFYLDPGVYYLWRQKFGFNFANPVSFTVTPQGTVSI